MNEVRNVIKQMICGKAVGKDVTPAEMYRALNEESLKAFHEVLSSIWEEEGMPPDLHGAIIIALYKNKGTRPDCGNYRDITLLSFAGKNPCLNHPEQADTDNLRGEPPWFPLWVPSRQKYHWHDLHCKTGARKVSWTECEPLFSIHRSDEGIWHGQQICILWTTLRKLGYPFKFVTLIQLFHNDMMER